MSATHSSKTVSSFPKTELVLVVKNRLKKFHNQQITKHVAVIQCESSKRK